MFRYRGEESAALLREMLCFFLLDTGEVGRV